MNEIILEKDYFIEGMVYPAGTRIKLTVPKSEKELRDEALREVKDKLEEDS